MSKLTQILLSLPGPNDTFINDLNGLLAEFPWPDKSPKFSREISVAEIKDGGLKLHNIKALDTAVKL